MIIRLLVKCLQSDQHLLPQSGAIDWRTTMRLLRGHEKQASLALMATVCDSGAWPQPAVAVHDALSRLMDIRLRDEEQ